MSSETDAVKRLGDLIKQSTPSIKRSQIGLTITQNEQTFEIAFSLDNKSVAKSTLIKK